MKTCKLVFVVVLALVLAFGTTACNRNKSGGTTASAKITMPSQSYIGLWKNQVTYINTLTIFAIDDSTIHFELDLEGTTTTGTAQIKNNEIVYTTGANTTGTMEFNEKEIILCVYNSNTYTYYGFSDKQEIFEFENGAITGYTGTATAVVIPSQIQGQAVTKIGYRAFYEKELTGVTIPNSVTHIGSSAFSGNQLTSVTIPNSVTEIGNSAFSGNQLTSVTIGNSVTTIENYAFRDNQLTGVTIPNSVTTLSGFSNNQLTGVTIPNSVITIGGGAFYENQLTGVTIPNSVTAIEGSAFSGNPLNRITIGGGVNLGDYSDAFDDFDAIYIINGEQAGTYALNNGEWNLPGGAVNAAAAFTRTIELKTPRMNGQDVINLQKRLLSLGYDAVGEADGYYGPASEGVIKYIQLFSGRGYNQLDVDGKVNQDLWNNIFYHTRSNTLKRISFKRNVTIDAPVVLDAFQKFIEWEINASGYTPAYDINRIVDGLLRNREYFYTYIQHYAGTEYECKVCYYFLPENNLVLRTDEGEMAPRIEYRLLDSRKFILSRYSGLNGLLEYDEIYDFNPQTGIFTLVETLSPPMYK